MAQQQLSGIPLGQDCAAIHSVLFADDLIILGKAEPQGAATFYNILQHFCCSSGQFP